MGLVYFVLVDYMSVNLYEVVFYCFLCRALWGRVYVVSVIVVLKDGLFFESGVCWLLCELVECV